jgi:hypothetical protein
MARPTKPTPWVSSWMGFRRGWGFDVGGFRRLLWVGFAVDGVSPWMGFRCGWVLTCAVGGFSPWMGFRRGFHCEFRRGWVSTCAVGGFRCGRRCRWVSKDHGQRDPSQSCSPDPRPEWVWPDPQPAWVCWVCLFFFLSLFGLLARVFLVLYLF